MKDTLVVFAYAQAGLGHMRVADALYDGLPTGARAVLLSSRDKRITYLHRLTSIYPLLRWLLEFFQNGTPEELFTRVVRVVLARDNTIPYQELSQILHQQIHLPSTILIVATHFGLAHQFAAIKEKFAKTHGVGVVLAVVVTDDSPQKVWAVPGADLIFCPSSTTKNALEAYHHTLVSTNTTTYIASPYMITPSFALTISGKAHQSRKAACDGASWQPIAVAVPVSGAAVQLEFLLNIIRELSRLSERFHFEVVSKESLFTIPFLHELAAWPRVTTHRAMWDRMIIEQYEALYRNIVITAEITKPSEQAFKALLTPKQVGGSILLFSQPIGRQERDNLRFFARHDLIPSTEEQELLWELSEKGIVLTSSPDPQLLEKAKHWRGLRLPTPSSSAAKFITWTLANGVWASMGSFSSFPEDPGLHSDGVARFWKRIAEYIAAT